MDKRILISGTVFLGVVILLLLFSGLAFASEPELKLGSRGFEVARIQEILSEADLYISNDISGYYGLNTMASVAGMQRLHGLNVTGEIKGVDWSKLGEIAMAQNLASKSNRQLVGYLTQYKSKYSSYASLADFGGHLDYVATFSYMIDNNGDLIGETPYDALALAEKMEVKPLVLVHNMLDEIDSAGASAVLSNPLLRKKLVGNIVSVINRDGYAGVNVDLEGVYPADREHYNRFLQDLAGALHPGGKVLTVSIPAKTLDDPQNNWSGAYDYAAIGKTADLIVLMAYDEHWYGGEPGPVASLPWVLRVIDYATSQIPREKIVLGIAAYGYDWSHSGTKAITWKEVGKLAADFGPASWHDVHCVPYFTYNTGGVRHEVWFENTYSLRFKLDVVNNYNLAGIALWRLGFEDADFWNLVASKFN